MAGTKNETINSLVHIDMKGGPPRLSYLLEMMALVAEWGGAGAGLLLEWEDMFPWAGPLASLARPGHYTSEDLATLLGHAATLGLQVVPLIQTFGHMEFVLKHEQFRHLRDIPLYPNCMRPVCVDPGGEVRALVRELVRQVVAGHGPGLATIHLGCDEVWSLGQSPATRAHMATSGATVTDMFLEHTAMAATTARSLAGPGVRVLVWDDMMRTASVEQLRRHQLDTLVEPVVWSYGPQLCFPPGMVERYAAVWGAARTWGGAAWRGATGSCSALPLVRHHVDNCLAWRAAVRGGQLGGAGLVVTGWARYDHYAAPCDLLPAALHSLCCCLAALRSGWTEATEQSVAASLGLAAPLVLETRSLTRDPEAAAPEPRYPGGAMLPAMVTYTRLAAEHAAVTSSDTLATWLNPWQLRTGFINPLQVQGALLTLSSLSSRLKDVGKILEREISVNLHEFTAEEWLHSNITPKIDQIDKILERAMSLLNRLKQEEVGL